MPKPKKDTEIILATAEELKTYATAKRAQKTQAKDFCQYLKETHKSSATEVIADLSGQTFSSISLKNVDLGNVIAGRREGKHTQFQNCDMTYTKLHSNSSMEGLEFTHCNMNNALLAADLGGVNFGIGSNITHLNLKQAYNIDKCLIHAECTVSQIEVGFPDLETFQYHMSDKIKDQEINQRYNAAHQAKVLKSGSVPPSPEVEVITAAPNGLGAQIGIPAIARAVTTGAVGAFNTLLNAGSTVASAIGTGLTTNMTIGAAASQDAVLLHQNAIGRIIDSSPKFSATRRDLNPNEVGYVKTDMVLNWIEANAGVAREDQVSLNEFARTQLDWDQSVIPHLDRLDLKGYNFSNLEFGEVVISKCNFSDTKFSQCNLDLASIKDCNFLNAELIETTAQKADFTRCTFNGSTIDKSNFTGATLMDADFGPSHNNITKISNSQFDYADMRSVRLDNTKITLTSLDHVNMQNVTGDTLMLFDVSIKQTNLSNAELENVVMREVDFVDSIIQNANFTGGVLEHVSMNNVKAQNINLDNTSQDNVTYKNTNLSSGTMNGAVIGNVTMDDSRMINMQAMQMKPYKISPAGSEYQDQDTQNVVNIFEDIPLVDPQQTQQDPLYNVAMLDAANKALDEKQQQPKNLTIINGDARGLNVSGSHLVGPKIIDTNLSHMEAQNIVIENGDIERTNLHGANLSGANGHHSEFMGTKLENVNATNTNMERIRVIGGEWSNVDASNATLRDATIGTPDSKLDIHNLQTDAATNFAAAEANVVDTKTIDQQVIIQMTNSDGQVVSTTVEKTIEQSNRIEEVMANNATNLITSSAAKVSGALNTAAEAASTVTKSLTTHKKSRIGLVVGILGGIVAGGVIAGLAASTFGLALIPIAIVAASAVGGGAIVGGITGSLIQNTNTGRGVAAIATTAVAATVLGPIGLVAAPVIALYNTITGKNSSLRSAFGSALETTISTPLRRIAGFVASVTSSEADVIEAQRIGQARQEASMATQAEKDKVKAITPDIHAQISDVTTQITSGQQHIPVIEPSNPKNTFFPKPSVLPQDPPAAQPKEGGWRSKFKKSGRSDSSHEETLMQERAKSEGVSSTSRT